MSEDAAALRPDALDAPAERSMRKVALAALAGTSIEWYDFFLYGTAAALIFPTTFFSQDLPPLAAQVLSLLTFAAGFVARPLGGIVFGHFGDRFGRKTTLVFALVLMGVSSTLIGLLPTHAVIGGAAPLALVALRFVQGLAIGGQWGGAMLLVTESAPAHQRGFWGAYPQAGAMVGLLLANLAFWTVDGLVSDAAFESWGWRIPFLASILLIGVSVYIQLTLEDTDAFKELARRRVAQAQRADEATAAGDAAASRPARRSPVAEALTVYPGRILLAAGAFLSIQVTFYIIVVFAVLYGTDPEGLGLSRFAMLVPVMIATVIQIPTQFAAAALSDKLGRRGIYMTGAVLTGAWAFAVFPLIDTGNFVLITAAILAGGVFLGLQYGPQAAFFTEMFSTDVRYSAASLGYQIGAIFGGSLAPAMAVLLWRELGIIYVSGYIAFACVVTLFSVLLLMETRGANINAARADVTST